LRGQTSQVRWRTRHCLLRTKFIFCFLSSVCSARHEYCVHLLMQRRDNYRPGGRARIKKEPTQLADWVPCWRYRDDGAVPGWTRSQPSRAEILNRGVCVVDSELRSAGWADVVVARTLFHLVAAYGTKSIAYHFEHSARKYDKLSTWLWHRPRRLIAARCAAGTEAHGTGLKKVLIVLLLSTTLIASVIGSNRMRSPRLLLHL
jgi:hypothetical protein